MSPVSTASSLNVDAVLDRLALRLPQIRHLIRADQPIEDLGLDSIDLVELLCVIESEFDVTVSDADFARSSTVGELAGLIQQRYDEKKVQS
jgi:acyl carrier protein